MALFSRKEYWDDRYKASPESSTEWYQSYKSMRHLLNPIHFAAQGTGIRTWNRPPSTIGGASPLANFPNRDACRILILGCGNSRCGEDMRNDGWTGRLVNLDFSSVVIEQMKKRYNSDGSEQKTMAQPPMEFICHDMITGLPFPDESFDLIICKGSFDAVLTGSCPVADIRTVVQESVRCLQRGHGIFFVVTNGNPDNRLEYLEYQNDINFYWDGVSCHTVGRPMSHQMDYVYICRRRLHPTALPESSGKPAPAMAVQGKENATNQKEQAFCTEQPAKKEN